MSIATESYITLNDTDKIGLSDTLDNYSIDDIKASGYVGAYDPLRYNNYTAKPGVTMWDDGGLKDMQSPFTTEQTGTPYPQTRHWTAGSGSYTGSIFSAVIWLQRINQGLPSTVINESNIEDYKLVTEMPANKMYYTVPNLDNWDGNATAPISASSWNDVKTFPSSYYAPLWGELKYHSNYGQGEDISVDVEHVYPYMMYEYDGYFYFQLINMDKDYYSFHMTTNSDDSDTIPFASSAMTPYDDATGISLGTTYNASFMASGVSDDSMVNYFGENNVPFDWAGPGDSQIWIHGMYNIDDQKYVMYLRHGGNGTWYYHAVFYSMLARKEDSLLFFANGGVKIIADKAYKPIIVGGVVTGITDDMTEPSELDDWDMGNTDHGISPAGPPAPPSSGDEDNDDPIPVTGAPYSSGLACYYVTTAGSVILNHISEAMGAWNLKDSGKDLYKNIISCKLIKSPAPIPVSGSESFTIYGVKLQYEGADITLPVVNDNPTASFGPYTITRKFNDFRDYAPYTKVEIYLPYCGWTVLPSHVVGRSVSVTYYTDIIAATCKAVVYCGSNVIAEAAGVIGLDIPMVTENAGAKAEAVTMGLLAYGKAGLQTALGIGAAVATKGKAGVKQAVSGLGDVVSAYSQTAMAFNQNYTEINGKNGDGCCIAGISAIVIKITRPKYGSNTTPPYVPSEYAHSTGFVSMKSAKVSSFTGLLVADNVDTSGISGATDREKQLIKLYLESGVYVNHPN